VAAAATPSADELAKLKRPELVKQLRKRGLRLTGGKAELADRLLVGWGVACSFVRLAQPPGASLSSCCSSPSSSSSIEKAPQRRAVLWRPTSSFQRVGSQLQALSQACVGRRASKQALPFQRV
jgi:hypothetical protein